MPRLCQLPTMDSSCLICRSPIQMVLPTSACVQLVVTLSTTNDNPIVIVVLHFAFEQRLYTSCISNSRGLLFEMQYFEMINCYVKHFCLISVCWFCLITSNHTFLLFFWFDNHLVHHFVVLHFPVRHFPVLHFQRPPWALVIRPRSQSPRLVPDCWSWCCCCCCCCLNQEWNEWMNEWLNEKFHIFIILPNTAVAFPTWTLVSFSQLPLCDCDMDNVGYSYQGTGTECLNLQPVCLSYHSTQWSKLCTSQDWCTDGGFHR